MPHTFSDSLHGFFKLLLFVNDSETNVSYVSEIRNCFSNIGPIDGKITFIFDFKQRCVFLILFIPFDFLFYGSFDRI